MAQGELLPDLYATEDQKKETKYGLGFAKWAYQSFCGRDKVGYDTWIKNNELCNSYATATQDMQQYKDWINPSGDTSYLNLKYQTPADMAKFIERIIGQQIKRKYKVEVSATDVLSKTKFDKEKAKAFAEVIKNRFNKKVGESVGMKMHSDNLDTGNTFEEVDIHFQTDFKLGEEISLEIAIASVLYSNEWSESEKKIRYNLITYGFAGTKTWLDESGVNTREINPRNFIYPRTERMGNLDVTWCGEIIRTKIGMLKAMSNGRLKNEDLIKIVKTRYPNEWRETYSNSDVLLNQYSDFEIDILDFEFKSYDVQNYTKNVSAKGRIFVDKTATEGNLPSKGGKTLYTGMWIIGTDQMVSYEREKNMMVPVSNIADAYSQYTIYKLADESLVKKCIPHIDELCLCYLKGQQLLSKIQPSVIAIDVEALKNVNMEGKGGKLMTSLDIIDILGQVGYALYSSKDVAGQNGNYRPIYEVPTSVANEMQAIRNQYEFALQKIRNNIGITEYSDSPPADALNGVTNAAIQLTNDAIWTLNDAYLNIYVNTAKKIAECVKNYSRYRGSFSKFTDKIGKYNTDNIAFLKEYALCNFEFNAVAEATDEEKAQLNQDIQIALQSQEISLDDAMYIRRFVDKNVKLAAQVLLLRRNQKTEEKMKLAEQNAQQNAMVQQQSLQQAAQNEQQMFQMQMEMQKMKGDLELQKQELKNQGALAVKKEESDGKIEQNHLMKQIANEENGEV